MHCRAEHSSRGRGEILLPLFTQSTCAPGMAATHKMTWLCRKLTPPLAAWIRPLFPCQLLGKPAEHRLTGEEIAVWTQDMVVQTKGGSHQGRSTIRSLDNLLMHLFCWIRVKFQDSPVWKFFSQIRKIFTVGRTWQFSWKQNSIWWGIDFPFSKICT